MFKIHKVILRVVKCLFWYRTLPVADHIYNTIQKVTMFQQSPNKIIMDGIEHNVLRGKCAR